MSTVREQVMVALEDEGLDGVMAVFTSRLSAILAARRAGGGALALPRPDESIDVYLREFGAEFRRIRLEAGLTLRDLAPVVGVSISTLSRIERGYRSMTHDYLRVARWIRDAQGVLEPQS